LGIATRGFKRSLFGYRPSEVDAALAERDGALAECGQALRARTAELEASQARAIQLEHVCDSLSDRVVGRDRELARLRNELDRLQEQGDRGIRLLASMADELEGMRAQARGQATRIRMRALRDAADLSERITELSRRPAEARERLLDSIGEAIARLGGGDEAVEQVRRESVAPVSAAEAGDEFFKGSVEVEIGPLADFSQLVGFEDAAAAITATSEISVRRFAAGRATLDLKLAEPVELLRELEERSPFEFRVRDRRFDRLVLDVDSEQAEAA
jgi:hypothetical protein